MHRQQEIGPETLRLIHMSKGDFTNDRQKTVETFRVKLGDYYRAKEEDDRLDAMWGDEPENSELEKAADEAYEKAWYIGAECWKLFTAITKSDIKCGDFLIMLDRNPAKFRRMAIA